MGRPHIEHVCTFHCQLLCFANNITLTFQQDPFYIFTFCSPHESRCDAECECKVKLRMSPSEVESKARNLLLMENLNVHMALLER